MTSILSTGTRNPHCVIPAKAGTQGPCAPVPAALDSRLCGNDTVTVLIYAGRP